MPGLHTLGVVEESLCHAHPTPLGPICIHNMNWGVCNLLHLWAPHSLHLRPQVVITFTLIVWCQRSEYCALFVTICSIKCMLRPALPRLVCKVPPSSPPSVALICGDCRSPTMFSISCADKELHSRTGGLARRAAFVPTTPSDCAHN